MHDRRKITRWSINHPAKIKFEGAEVFIDAQLLDINFKGLQIAFKPKLIKDLVVKFKLVLSDELALEAEAWIAWHRNVNSHNIYGLYFTKIRDSDKEQIYKFVFKHSPHQIHRQWWKGLPEKKKGGEGMEDRRIFERFAVSFPVKLLDTSSGQEREVSTCDVSAKGVGVLMNKQLTPGTPLEVWLKIPDHGEPLYTRGTVAWSKTEKANICRAGIELEKADLMGLSRVLRVV